MFGKKAQTEAMTIVIITGIVIALVGAAYLWGKPLIEKRSTAAEFSTMESFILELDNAIKDIANSGSGSKSLDLPFGQIRMHPMENALNYTHFTPQQMMNSTYAIPIKTANMQDSAIYGEAQPRIITLEVEPVDEVYEMLMKLRYRELVKNTYPRKGFIINLHQSGPPAGTRSVSVSFGGTEVVVSGASNGGDLIKTTVNVELI